MKRYFLLLVLLCCSHAVFSQCSSRWVEEGKTTIFASQQLYYSDAKYRKPIEFDSLVAQIRIPRLDSVTINIICSGIDSLKRLTRNDEIERELIFWEHDLNSVFQVITSDSIEFALYNIDTVLYEVDKKQVKVIVYKFSTSFWKLWNEDFPNYYLYYTREFGVVTVFGPTRPLFGTHWKLIDNCKMRNSNSKYYFRHFMKNWKYDIFR